MSHGYTAGEGSNLVPTYSRAPKVDPIITVNLAQTGEAIKIRQSVLDAGSISFQGSIASACNTAGNPEIHIWESVNAQAFKNLLLCFEQDRYVPQYEWQQGSSFYQTTAGGTLVHPVVAYEHVLRLIDILYQFDALSYLNEALTDFMAISKRYLTIGVRNRRVTSADSKHNMQTDALYLHAIGVKILGEDLYYTDTMFDVFVDLMKFLRSHGSPTNKLTKKAAAHPKIAKYVMENLLDMVEEELDFSDCTSDKDAPGDDSMVEAANAWYD